MKRFLLISLLIGGMSLLCISVLSSCAPRHPRHGYDSQRWLPREHKQVNLRTFTGYPRERGKRK